MFKYWRDKCNATKEPLSTFCILYFRSFHNKITANGKVTQRTPWNFKSFHNESEANCLDHTYRATQKIVLVEFPLNKSMFLGHV